MHQIICTNTMHPFTNKEVLHAYVKFQELLQAALVFAVTKRNVGNVLLDYVGACVWLTHQNVNSNLIGKLCYQHTQTGDRLFPIIGGDYHNTHSYEKWKGNYGDNRRLFLKNCIETLRVELNRRGYSF